MSRLTRCASYALVVVLSLELALWGSFLVGARPFGTGFPVSAVIAAVSNLVLGIAGARVLRRTLGAVVPGVLWLVVALELGGLGHGSDSVVPGTLRGYAFLAAGAIAAAVAVGYAMGAVTTPQGTTPRGTEPEGTTPQGPDGR